ncbi:unnamed protein product, partial [Mesorhabditis belari]|uniref:Uncharacterized protein n=1 Tax=Mesorhabditis belari TaxID=2138241 RepID=A0AAF3FQU1_9BILA
MGDAMCSRQDYGSCLGAKWTPYSIENGDAVVGSAAQFDNDLPVACGSQCDAKSDSPCATSSCSQCDGQQVAGANTPVTRRYNMGTKQAANLQFLYETFSVPDRITVTYEGDEIFDSGCVGTEGERTTPIGFDGNSMEVRVDVEPNCDGTTSTAWYFTLPCVDGPPTTPPQPNTTSPIPSTTSGDCRNRQCSEYKCLDDTRAHCGPSGYLLSFGYKYCNSFIDHTNLFTSAGKRFFECVRPKLMEYMEGYLDSAGDSVNCDDLKLKAFDSHIPIFRDCDYCDMIFLNAPQFLYVVAGELATEPLAGKEACDLMAMCPRPLLRACSMGSQCLLILFVLPRATHFVVE